MDNFHEQLVKRKKRPQDLLAQILIVTVAVIAAGAAFICCRAYLQSFGSIVGAVAAFAIVYVAYRLLMQFNVEFEFTFCNGEIDIDKILSEAQRKRVITVNLKTIDDFGLFDKTAADRLSERHFDLQIDARTYRNGAVVYYAAFKHKQRGIVLLVFEPDEIMLGEINAVRDPRPFGRRL